MKIGEESICYQHHQAEMILENLLKGENVYNYKSNLKEAIEKNQFFRF